LGNTNQEDPKLLVNNSYPAEDECRHLLLKIIEQAVRDFINLRSDDITSAEKLARETAKGLLFDDDFLIDWGGISLDLERILALWDLEVDWFRERVLRLEKIKIEKNKEISLLDLVSLDE
jgi:hypothetical protein